MTRPSFGWDGLERRSAGTVSSVVRLGRSRASFGWDGLELDACIPVAHGKVRRDPTREFRSVTTIRVQVAYLRRRDNNLLSNARDPVGYALSEEGRRRVAEALACL